MRRTRSLNLGSERSGTNMKSVFRFLSQSEKQLQEMEEELNACLQRPKRSSETALIRRERGSEPRSALSSR